MHFHVKALHIKDLRITATYKMELLTSLTICVMFIMALVWYNGTRKPSLRPPPGPWPLPFVGNILSINTAKMHLTFYELAQKYGKIFRVSLLGEDIVVINDINMLRKAFLAEEYGEVFADRPLNFFNQYITFNADIAFGRSNQVTYTLRNMLQKGLKVFGDDAAKFELQAREELDRLVMELNTLIGKDVDICLSFKKSFANWMSTLVTGQKAKENDSEIIWDLNESAIALADAGINTLLTRRPVFRFLPGNLGRMYRKCVKDRDRVLRRFFYLRDDEFHDFIKKAGGLVGLLIEIQNKQNQRARNEIVSDLRGLILDIFVAGTDTTYSSLVSSFALLLNYPDCKKKLKAEVDTIIGNSRPPSIGDRRYMPYTDAFLLELHRYTSQTPLGLPHMCQKDVDFEGYRITKNSMLLPNIWFIHHDEKLWHDPWNFRPERFLDATGELLSADHELRQACIPFSIGRRACPGKTLALTKTFLYLTRIVQEFDIQPPSSGHVPKVDPRCYSPGSVIRVGEYLCQISPRNNSN